MARNSFGSFMLLLCFCFFGAVQAFAIETVTLQGGGMTRTVSLGMNKADIISSIGAPSRIKSEGYCLQYDTFDMSLFLNKDMRVDRIYLGKFFRGSIGGKSGPEAGMKDVYRDYGSPLASERVTYSPSPSVQTRATVESEDKVSPAVAEASALPMEYRGDRTMYELYSHDMVMKYKYVLDTEGVAFWMDERGAVYAVAIYRPPGQAAMAQESLCIESGAIAGESLCLEPVYFDFDKYKLKKQYLGVLARDSDLIKERENLLVTIEGHTDSIGTVGYNQKLSERRAKSVYDYLAKKGVPASQLKTVGYGKLRPVADNRTKEGRAMNRRAELKTDETPQSSKSLQGSQ
jgi:outer membrane protein OmpA-like peptidoglycan-associated protein